MNCFFTKITLFFHYFSLLHRLRQRIEQRPHLWICQHFCQKFRIDFIGNSCIIIFLLCVHLWIQIFFLVERFLKKLCIFSSVIIQNIRIHICNHIDLSMAGITLYRFDISTIQFQLISNTEIAGTVKNDNMYEFASSHCNDFKDLRDDEDIVINREWILNKLAEVENE